MTLDTAIIDHISSGAISDLGGTRMLGTDWSNGDNVPVRPANRFLLQAGDNDQFYLTLGLTTPSLPAGAGERPTEAERLAEVERPHVVARLVLSRSGISSLLAALHSGL